MRFFEQIIIGLLVCSLLELNRAQPIGGGFSTNVNTNTNYNFNSDSSVLIVQLIQAIIDLLGNKMPDLGKILVIPGDDLHAIQQDLRTLDEPQGTNYSLWYKINRILKANHFINFEDLEATL